MGQQQLLLIVLSAIIVGISIVVGINMFSEGAGQSNLDAVTQDLVTIGTRAQEWYRKPALLGGGGRAFDNCTLDTLNFPAANDNGSYAIQSASGDLLTVLGTGVEDLNGNGSPLSVTVDVTPDSIRAVTITR